MSTKKSWKMCMTCGCYRWICDRGGGTWHLAIWQAGAGIMPARSCAPMVIGLEIARIRYAGVALSPSFRSSSMEDRTEWRAIMPRRQGLLSLKVHSWRPCPSIRSFSRGLPRYGSRGGSPSLEPDHSLSAPKDLAQASRSSASSMASSMSPTTFSCPAAFASSMMGVILAT